MNHELRTPLNGILGYAQILQRDPATTSKQQKGLSVIHQCGSHLLTLINDILDLSKLEVQKMDLYPQDFHFANFLTTTVEICRIKAEQKGIAFHYHPINLPTAVHADDKRLRQVLLNLLSNAVKFTDFGSVTFQVEAVGSQQIIQTSSTRIRFQVEDTGIGIPKEKLQSIFLPFEQAGKRERNSEGTGLGLAISQQIVQMMGSSIQVNSIPGKCSTFWFEVDVPAADWLAQAITINQKVIGYQGERRKILVIDDRQENRAVAIGMLAPLGFKLAQADDGQVGLDLALQMRPDLIITDVMMSKMNGLEMTRRLRQLPDFAKTPIIASPASLSQVDMQEALEAGCSSFFPKPIEFSGLLGELQRHLGLQWIYETTSEVAEVSAEVLSSVDLVMPSSHELATVYKAAQDGFMSDIQQEANRLKQLNPQYAPLANKLLELSQKFDDEAILNLLAPYI
ncbi:hybrid sensor histidine kinase/response regulator [Nostoc minutum NIES-26]|uniref:Circadian input-output histidine kinase CikA n=1 Tax=Nostoc minutum NIES-26 TaxID=1844469 RepID=A0A367RVM8_9NOSO|nr:hybrid sensor histidine kinase/response regulator [Nostoc minutum NIES-26]